MNNIIEDEKVVSTYKELKSVDKTADKFKMDKVDVLRLLNNNKVDFVKVENKDTQIDFLHEHRELIVSMYNKKSKQREFKEVFNCTYTVLQTYLYYIDELDLYGEELEKTILDMYNEGIKVVDIYRCLDVNNIVVSRVIGKNKFLNSLDETERVKNKPLGKLATKRAELAEMELKVLDKDFQDRVMKLRMSGLDLNKIVQEIGCPKNIISKTIREIVKRDTIDLETKKRLLSIDRNIPPYKELVTIVNYIVDTIQETGNISIVTSGVNYGVITTYLTIVKELNILSGDRLSIFEKYAKFVKGQKR